MNDLLVCCNPCGCDSQIVLDGNAIWITLIISATIIITILSCVLSYYGNKKSKKIIDLEKEKKQLEENLSKKASELNKEQEKNKEVDSTLLNNEKRKKEFLDYCYKMAKSLEKGNEKQREDCWKILLHIHADCIPDELKQEYKVGNNAVENVGKTE